GKTVVTSRILTRCGPLPLLLHDRADRLPAPARQLRHVDDLPIVLEDRAGDLGIEVRTGRFQPLLGTPVGTELRNQIPLSHSSMLAHQSHDKQHSADSRKETWRMMVPDSQRATTLTSRNKGPPMPSRLPHPLPRAT